MPIEDSLNVANPIVVSVHDEIKRTTDILESRIPPLLLRSPPPPQVSSRSVTPELDTLPSSIETDKNENNSQTNSNFNLDFAFDLNSFDENETVSDDLSDLSSQITTNRNLLVESNNKKFEEEEEEIKFSANNIVNEGSNWANFDSKPFASSNTNPENNKKLEDTNLCNEIKNEVPTNDEEKLGGDDDDDDEWADFVDNTPVSNFNIPNEINNSEFISKVDTNQNRPIANTETTQPLEVKIKDSPSDQIVLDNLVNKLFTNLNANGNYFSETDKTQEMFIDDDETWKQLKAYTSVIDASISLQFKWNLSCLEENCLNSLNLVRVENNQVRILATFSFITLNLVVSLLLFCYEFFSRLITRSVT
jgi:hypothetical protein